MKKELTINALILFGWAVLIGLAVIGFNCYTH